MFKNPLVSIITPSFNRIKYLEACINSVVKQSYPYLEHIVVDGGSSDGTIDLLQRCSKESLGRLRYMSEKDDGAGIALNRGIAIAKGAIYGFLCSDDMYKPETIKKIVSFFIANPQAFFLHGACEFIDDKTKKILHVSMPKKFTLDELVNSNNYVSFQSAFFRKEVIEEIGGFDLYGNDYDFVIRAVKKFQPYQIEEILGCFRVHRESETGTRKGYMRVVSLDYQVSRKHGGRFFSSISRRYYILRVISHLKLYIIWEWFHRLRKLRNKAKVNL